MRVILLMLLFFVFCQNPVLAQSDPVAVNKPSSVTINAPINPRQRYVPLDSVDVNPIKEQFRADSIARYYLFPDSLRKNQFIAHIYKDNLSNLISFSCSACSTIVSLQSGQARKGRETWVIVVIIFLLFYTAFINIFLNKDLSSVIQSYYNNNALSQADKEGGFINSWTVIALFLLFCGAFGLMLYQLTVYKNLSYPISGLQLFGALSVGVALLFMLKYLILRFLGFIFNINGLVSQYVAILNLTYFNIAFVLLTTAISFSLLARVFIPVLLTSTLVLIAIIFAWQYLRNSVNIISNIRFHKIYLFIYLCALEICPVLILIKAVNI